MNLHNSPNGRAYTLSQEGCNNIIRSIDTENKNVLLFKQKQRESGDKMIIFLKK